MHFTVLYHPDVKKIGLPQINKDIKIRIKKAIEEKLMTEPAKYGKPLRKTLKKYWKLRVGDYKVVYEISGDEVFIYGIIHRKKVYDEIKKRI